MTFEKVAGILAEYKGIEVDKVKAESSFEDLELDSLDTVELVMNLEDAFGVSIELDDKIRTVGDLVAAIEAK